MKSTDLRKGWEEKANAYLQENNIDSRIDSRPLEEQGINRIPQIHLGKNNWHMMQKGKPTARNLLFEKIQSQNQELELGDLMREALKKRQKNSININYETETQRIEKSGNVIQYLDGNNQTLFKQRKENGKWKTTLNEFNQTQQDKMLKEMREINEEIQKSINQKQKKLKPKSKQKENEL